MSDQKPMWTRCLGGFSVMWVTKLLISQVKKRIFCPKTTKFGPKLAFLVDLGQAMQAFSVPCWWVIWWLWRAGCISQDTYLLYIINHINKKTVFVSFASCKSSKYSWRMPVRRESSILTASCLFESSNQYINIIHQYIGHIVDNISTRKKFSLPLQVASHPITLDRCLS